MLQTPSLTFSASLSAHARLSAPNTLHSLFLLLSFSPTIESSFTGARISVSIPGCPQFLKQWGAQSRCLENAHGMKE